MRTPKEEAIFQFRQTADAYMAFLPRIEKLVTEYEHGDREVPGLDGETYGELLHREHSHFLEIYNAEHLRALQEGLKSDEEYSDAAAAFFIDLEELTMQEAHVEFVLGLIE